MTVYTWSAICLACVYGGASAWAGMMQLKRRKIPLWSAAGMLLSGVSLAASAVVAVTLPSGGQWAIPGLLLLHLLALRNGYHMYGRVHLTHHVVRFVLSLIIAVPLLLSP